MKRYLLAEQFLGMIFTHLVEKDIFKIEISKLNELEKMVAPSLIKMNNTMLYISDYDIFMMANEYNDFFEIYKSYIGLQEELMMEVIKNQVYKEEFIFKLRQYFTSGIPEDVNETVMNLINVAI